MTIKNKTSQGKNTFDKIQKLLAQNGAKKVMFDYDNDGTLEAISFALEINGKITGFQLPAMVDNVYQILYGHMEPSDNERISQGRKDQAYKTAWANIRDWIDAQLALVATRQVEMAQVFLPYMVMKDDRTLYQKIISDPQFLLGNGN